MDNGESAVPFSRHSVIHDAHCSRRQHLAQQKSALFDCVGGYSDSICDLQCLLTYVDNYANKRHKADATRSSTTNGSARRASNGAAAPSSFLSSSYIPQLPLPPHNAPAALPASDAGIFGGLPARPGDLVDNLTRSGSFSFLSELFDTARLFELRDFRITRVTPKGEATEQFAACMHLVLDLAD